MGEAGHVLRLSALPIFTDNKKVVSYKDFTLEPLLKGLEFHGHHKVTAM